MIFIHHVEKTGLTSVEWSLHKAGLRVWNGGALKCVDLPRTHGLKPTELKEKHSIDVYVSHFDTYFHNPQMIPAEQACTVIREPVSRTISHVRFLYDNLDKPWMTYQTEICRAVKQLGNDYNNLEHWKHIFELCPYLENMQCVRLGGTYKHAKQRVDKMLVVEPFERLDIFYERIHEHLGTNEFVPLYHINKSKSKWNVSDEVKSWIAEKNRFDTMLYAGIH